MRTLLILALALCATTSPLRQATDAASLQGGAHRANQLVGTWRLVSAQDIAPDGAVTYPFGRDASGVLTYDAAGTVTTQVMRKERTKWAAFEDAEPEPLLSYVAYFGTLEVDATKHIVTHHIRGHLDPTRIGTDILRQYGVRRLAREEPAARRLYELTGDKLMLIELDRPVRHATWERVR